MLNPTHFSPHRYNLTVPNHPIRYRNLTVPNHYITSFSNLQFIAVVACTSDAQCPAKQSCVNGDCVNPCEREGVCKAEDRCEVISHLARCLPGKKGKVISAGADFLQ